VVKTGGDVAAIVARGQSHFWAILALLTAAMWPTLSAAQPLGAELLLDLSGGNFNGAGYTQVARAPGRPNDVFVSRQDGNIYRFDLTTNTQSLFLDLATDDISTGQYWGLLGFTFAPDFDTSGDMYVHVADDRSVAGHHHRIYIRRYTVANPLSNDTNTPAANSGTNIIRWGQPLADHSGGWIGFHPNDPDTLWITSGDGGNSDSNRDTLRTGQNPNDLLGGILRINVSGSGSGEFGNYSIPANNPFASGVGGAREVFAYGMRSPWQGSFDRATGDFFVGDVGAFQDTTVPIYTSGDEEINFIRNGSAGGQNFGWRVMEGDFCAPAGGQQAGDLPCGDPSFTPPAYVYDYGGIYGAGGAPDFTGRSVTGGYVYRGPVTELQGMYIFGDWSSHQIWGVKIDRDANGGRGGVVPGSLINLSTAFGRQTQAGSSQLEGVTSFGEDALGNLYYLELGGELYRITGEIANADYNNDGIVNAADYTVWRNSLGSTLDLAADGSGPGGVPDGVIDMFDFQFWKDNYGEPVPSSGASADNIPEPTTAWLLLMGTVLTVAHSRRASRRA